MEQRSIEEVMLRLAEADQAPAMADLRGISDLSKSESAEFRVAWQAIPAARRRRLAGAMYELAEENTDLDFREAFLQLLHDDDAEVRIAAVQGLWEDERLSTLRRLLRLLQEDEVAEVRAASASGLGHFSYRAALEELDDQVVAQLLEALLAAFHRGGETVEVRRRLLESLGYYSEDPDVIAAITTSYRSGEQLWQESALLAMGRSMHTRWLPEIGEALGSELAPLRYEAARASGEYGDLGESLLPVLLPLVDDDDSEVALEAIWALGQIGGDRARKALKRVMRSGDPARHDAAEEALQELEFNEDPLFGSLR